MVNVCLLNTVLSGCSVPGIQIIYFCCLIQYYLILEFGLMFSNLTNQICFLI